MRSFSVISSIILNSITQPFIASLDQQLNWAIKLCFNRQKFVPSRDLKIYWGVLLIRYFLDLKLLFYFWRLSQTLLSAFKTVSLPTFNFSEIKTTRNWDCQVRHRTSILEKRLINLWCTLLNSYYVKHLI